MTSWSTREPMAEAVKYLFDRAFESPAKGAGSFGSTAAQKLQEEWERKMADACSTAYEEGRAEGEAEARKGIELETRDQVGVLLTCAEQLLNTVNQECEGIRKEAIQLASTTATLLAKELIERMPVANLERIFAEALEHAGDAPHIALTVNDDLVESIQKTITSIAAERGFTGNIIVLGDPEIQTGDCCLQWADGGISLDFEKTRNAIAQIVNRHLDASDSQPQAAPAVLPELPVQSGPAPQNDDAGSQTQSETESVSASISGSGEMQ